MRVVRRIGTLGRVFLTSSLGSSVTTESTATGSVGGGVGNGAGTDGGVTTLGASSGLGVGIDLGAGATRERRRSFSPCCAGASSITVGYDGCQAGAGFDIEKLGVNGSSCRGAAPGGSESGFLWNICDADVRRCLNEPFPSSNICDAELSLLVFFFSSNMPRTASIDVRRCSGIALGRLSEARCLVNMDGMVSDMNHVMIERAVVYEVEKATCEKRLVIRS